jgi:hypothetical protein
MLISFAKHHENNKENMLRSQLKFADNFIILHIYLTIKVTNIHPITETNAISIQNRKYNIHKPGHVMSQSYLRAEKGRMFVNTNYMFCI